MSGKPCGLEGSEGSPVGEEARLPYPEISALPDVRKIMKDLGIESTVSQGCPDSGSPDTLVRPGGLGFESFFGGTSHDMGLPSCQTSGEFPSVEQIMKDLSIESPVSQGIPENIAATSNVLDSPSHSSDVGFKEEVLIDNKELKKDKKPDVAPASSEKKPALDHLAKKADIGKPS